MRDKSKRRMSFGLTVAICCLYMTGNANAGNVGGTIAEYKAESSYIAPGKQQGVTLKGRVVNENGEGLPGVTVVLKGTTTGTSTDINGNFSLTVPQTGGTLVLSFIGYTTQEVAIGGQTTFNVTLQPDVKALEEIVVVGYGTQKKSDVTGSVETVSSEDFVKGQVTTPEQLIQGKVAGVQITSNGGAPGSGSQIRIRGGASLYATNDPLIVIDGVPVSSSGVSGSANPLSFINPEDIASFNILKDASATAIYGSRASNGVIIITTKKGTAGQKFGLNFSTQHSMSVVSETINVLNGDEFRELILSDTELAQGQKDLLGTENTDWQELIYREAYTTDNNLSLSGAIKMVPYRLSLGYLNQDGILKTSNFERATVGLSLNPSFLDDHLTTNINFKGAKSNSFFANEGAIGSAIIFDPTQPVYSGDNTKFGGFFQWQNADGWNTLSPVNPISMLEQREDISEVNRWIGNVQLDYKLHFLPDLRANLNIGTDRSNSEGHIIEEAELASNRFGVQTISRYSQEKENNLVDFYLNYLKEFGANRFDVTGGYSFQEFIAESPDYAFSNNVTGEPIGTLPDFVPTYSQHRLKSYFGRMNYALLDRYIFTGTVRYDGSTRFAEDNRWGIFPAFAFAWRMSEENFLKNVNVLSDLKLRLGYGITGQQDINSDFPYLARYTRADNTAQYQLGNIFYPTFRSEGYDANIKWEETATYNAGLDFGFAKNRVTGSLDYFFKDTKDLLAQVTVPAGSNLTNLLWTNVGNMETHGLEAALNFTAVSTEKITWNVGINGTYIDQEITSLSKVDNPDFEGYARGGIEGGTDNTIQRFKVGYAPNAFFVYKQVYDENGKPVEGLYADLNGDGQVTPADKYLYKKPAATFNMGFNTQLTYGNWDLSMVLRGNFGNYVYNNVYSNLGARQSYNFSGYLNNVSQNVLETNFSNYRLESDYYVENASFLRMDNLSLGYNFGKVLGDKVGLRATASVQNAFVITNYNGIDPEHSTGIDYSLYPRPRVFSVGLNVNL